MFVFLSRQQLTTNGAKLVQCEDGGRRGVDVSLFTRERKKREILSPPPQATRNAGAFAATVSLGAFSADSPCQLDVLGHDGHPLGVDSAQVGVLEQAD